jgi:Neuraminidase (sialidase)
VLVSRSTDGLQWSAPVKVLEDSNRDIFDDKEAITADPTDARYVYVVWDRLQGMTGPSSNFRGPAYFARTANGGASWEPAKSIFDPGANAQTIGNEIVVLPDGTLVNAFTWIQNATASTVAQQRLSLTVIRSTDKGVTWSAPILASDMQPVGVSDVKTGAPVRSGSIVASVTVDAASGALYAVWEDGRFSQRQREGIAMVRSTDGGLTWSAPVQVNQVPQVQAFTPAVAARGGEVAVTYYDFRKDTDDPKVLLASYWRIISEDGGRTWGEAPLAEPFDLASAALTDTGYFLGDYEGLVAANGRFLSFFVTSAAGTVPASVYATWKPTGGTTLHNGRTEVNRYVLRREIEGRGGRRRGLRKKS